MGEDRQDEMQMCFPLCAMTMSMMSYDVIYDVLFSLAIFFLDIPLHDFTLITHGGDSISLVLKSECGTVPLQVTWNEGKVIIFDATCPKKSISKLGCVKYSLRN